MDKITLPAGTIIHFKGMPFRLPADTEVEGRRENYDAAMGLDVDSVAPEPQMGNGAKTSPS